MPLTKVTSGVIAANAVIDSFGTQSITGDKLGLTAINANNIVSGSVTGDKLGATSINANNIVNGTITGTKIAANTITGDDIGQNAISANNIATNAIENYTALTNRPLSNRNIVINGAMAVVQRNANTTSITTAGYYSPDRWKIEIGTAGTWTMNVDSAGVNRAGPNEFGNSCNLICTTADSSLATGDYFILAQYIEGRNLQQIKKGTANAESITVSFWAKSSNTGTFICELVDLDNSRQCSQSYTISTAGTWERKTLTFPADTTGRFDNDNAGGLALDFWLAAGTTYTSGSLDTVWAPATNANRAAGQFNLAGNINNYFAITGVQLEVGSVATPFEMRNYGQELIMCQRYYQSISTGILTGIGNGAATTAAIINEAFCPLFVPLRASPTMGSVSVTQFDADSLSNATVTPTVNSFNANRQLVLNFTGLNADLLDNRAGFVRINAPLTISAEL